MRKNKKGNVMRKDKKENVMEKDNWRKPLKPIIGKLVKEWFEQATSEEKQKFCDDANAFATVLRTLSKK